MRVTQNMINHQFLRNLQQNYQNMERYNSKIASGRTIQKPSDDPIGTVQAMNIRSSLTQMEQFKQNAQDGLTWMEVTEGALSNLTSVIQRVRELTVQGSNGTNGVNDLRAIASEVGELKDHLGVIANTMVGDRFVFAGTDTHTAPFQNGTFVNTNENPLNWNVGQGMDIKVNMNGTSVFKMEYDGLDIFETLDAIANELQNGNNPERFLKHLDAQLDNVLTQRSILGANVNQLELSVNRLDNMYLSTEKFLSETEDADLAKAITDLTNQETIMRATLSSGSRIFQQSLVDFLR
jgi:flagellar hook-associated protein 3 FlgL